jgi:hypothetical protein
VGSYGLAFPTEENTGCPVVAVVVVVAEHAVAVLVSDRDAAELVRPKLIALKQPMLDAPADVHSIAAVSQRPIAPHYGKL